VPVPELHLLMGVVQHLFSYLKRDDSNLAEEWRNRSSVSLDHYQRLNGNNARKLLKKTNILEEISPTNKYINAFKAFNKVVEASFGYLLMPNYIEQIEWFRQEITAAAVHITPKIHAVLFHVEDFCEKTKRGLAYYSEQASEQIHHAFNMHSLNFNINSSSPEIGPRLLRSVCAFNSEKL
jgi:hypothetical protein